jgi:flagellar hook assembly protein FlgD
VTTPETIAAPVDFLRVYGNPARSGSVSLRFGTTRAARVEMKVYDVAGRLIRTIVDGHYRPGAYTVAWNGADGDGRRVRGGVYFVRIRRDGGADEAQRIVMLR